MLAIAYAASIGGIATLIGTPPNLVLAGLVKEQYNVEISFAQWLMIGLPLYITLLVATWFILLTPSGFFQIKAFLAAKMKSLGSWYY